jgi:hypothetical protein
VIGEPISFIASPERAVAIVLSARRELPFTVLASPASAADDLIAVAGFGLVSAVDAAPEDRGLAGCSAARGDRARWRSNAA